MSFLAVLASAFEALPLLLKVYQSIVDAVGKEKAVEFANDVARVTKLVQATRDPGLSFDEKRKLRLAALKEGNDLWERSLQ